MTNKRCTRTNDADSDQQLIDRTAAERFLARLDGDAQSWTFQTFDDNRTRKHRGLARILHGTLGTHFETLCSLNRTGAGIFVTVNETDGQGRSQNNIIRVRAVWQEDDGDGRPLPLEPHIVVETSPSRFHRYLLVENLSAPEHQAVQASLVARYGSDPSAKDLARVLRLPGFLHRKGKPFGVRVIHESHARPYSRNELLGAFPIRPVSKSTADTGHDKQIHPDRAAQQCADQPGRYDASPRNVCSRHRSRAGHRERCPLSSTSRA